MPVMVTDGAMMTCSFGTAPCSFRVTSQQMCLASSKPAATIQDMAGKTNISGFGMCMSLANPQVASATAAALGALTPQPCNCMAMGPWVNVKPVPLIKNIPCIGNDAKLICGNGMGIIQFGMPGQTKVMI